MVRKIVEVEVLVVMIMMAVEIFYAKGYAYINLLICGIFIIFMRRLCDCC